VTKLVLEKSLANLEYWGWASVKSETLHHLTMALTCLTSGPNPANKPVHVNFESNDGEDLGTFILPDCLRSLWLSGDGTYFYLNDDLDTAKVTFLTKTDSRTVLKAKLNQKGFYPSLMRSNGWKTSD
jgi:hypothetical protein